MSESPAQGQFFWRDLITSDPEKAQAFYTQLFGWTIDPNDMGEGMVYNILQNNGVGFGGLMNMADMGITGTQAMPAHWLSYVRVNDVDAITKRVAELGGTVHEEPRDIPGVGRFSVVADPQGAAFSPMSTSMPVDDPTVDVPQGGVIWNELMTGDVDSAIAFYRELIGYDIDTQNVANYGNYHMLRIAWNDETPGIGGIGQKPDTMPMAAWGIYFRVPDIEAAQKRVAELGGENHSPVMDIPGVGRMSVVVDPTGAYFSMLEPAPM